MPGILSAKTKIDLERSREEDGGHHSFFSVGAVSVEVTGTYRDVDLGPALRPFRVQQVIPDMNVCVEWVDSLGPTAGDSLFDSGTTWRLCEDEAGFQFDISAPTVGGRPYKKLLVDRRFRHATLLMSEESFARFPSVVQSLEYPLDELLIMHRLTQEKAIELHGCGIVRADGTGNLFVGHSGAGKSTTTRLWTEREDVEVLSDDRIIVRRDDALSVRTPLSRASSAAEPGVLRLRDRSASPTGHFAQDDKLKADCNSKKRQMRMYGTPWHGEAMYASPGCAGLTRIFVLEHGRGNVITRLSPSHAVAELFARSFVPFHRHEYVDSALLFLEELVDTVPCYRYSFEPDERAVEKIAEFRD